MAKTFPKVLYVKVENGGTGPEYFNAGAAVDGLVEMGVKAKIAIYRLESTVECEGVVKTKPLSSSR
jgi:hypothetical protein